MNISNSQAQAGAYAMVLGEINGMRQLPVIIGSAEAQSMMIEMRGIVPPRPLTHTLFASQFSRYWEQPCCACLFTKWTTVFSILTSI